MAARRAGRRADLTDHCVPVPCMIEQVRRVIAQVRQPVTCCENCVPWQHKLRAEKLKARQVDDLCDRFNVTAV